MAKAEKKLDIFPHIFPAAYFERMKRIAEGNPGLAAALKRWMNIPVLWNLDQRIRMRPTGSTLPTSRRCSTPPRR